MVLEEELFKVLIKFGSLRLDKIKKYYEKTYGKPMKIRGKLSKWIKRTNFKRIKIEVRDKRKGVYILSTKDQYSFTYNKNEKESQLLEAEVVNLVSKKGSLRLDRMRFEYERSYGKSLAISGKLSNWVKKCKGLSVTVSNGLYNITTTKGKTKDAHIQSNRDIVEAEVIRMLHNTGCIKLDQLRNEFVKAYGKSLEIAGKLSDWVNMSDEILVEKKGNGTYFIKAKNALNNKNNHSQVPDCDIPETKTKEEKEKKSASDIIKRIKEICGGSFRPLQVFEDIDPVIELLSQDFSDNLRKLNSLSIRDIVLDIGRKPYCWYNGERKFISEDDEDRVVTRSDLEHIKSNCGRIGSDNRAGMNNQLHRVSCIRNNYNEIVGYTIRVGRHMEGNVDMIGDILSDSDVSILLLGLVSRIFFIYVCLIFFISTLFIFLNFYSNFIF